MGAGLAEEQAALRSSSGWKEWKWGAGGVLLFLSIFFVFCFLFFVKMSADGQASRVRLGT